MKLSFPLIAPALLCCTGSHLFAIEPILQERFNGSDSAELINEAQPGLASSGVSGKPDDLCYPAPNLPVLEPGARQGPSPAALLDLGPSLEGAQEVTISLWYKPAREARLEGTLVDAFNFDIFIGGGDPKVPIVWLKAPNEPFRRSERNWFRSQEGFTPWDQPEEWIFLAIAWSNAERSMRFYQGTKTSPAAQVTEVTNPNPEYPNGIMEGDGPIGRSIANTRFKHLTPFDGSMDNVRFYSKRLDDADIEKIRLADSKNEQPALKN